MGTKESPVAGTAADDGLQAAGPRPANGDEQSTPALNQSTIIGRLVAEPDRRTLPSGVVAASFSLTVRAVGEKTTSVPIVWYDPPKRIDAWAVNDVVVVRGAVVRRFFRSAAGLGSSTEVVVAEAQLWRHPAKVRRLLDRCATPLGAVLDTD